ncbi:heme A synthase [Rhodobacteraceae bacterium W635]|uniref:heme A synthase n=1 Tax=Nioella halotolerans TaxID=2303578 RepID=UPI000E3D6467|nr:heme A synthase [Rhodobacteraceae bacterium W635]
MSGKRSIFEEVEDTRKAAATPGALSAGQGRRRNFARAWLMVLFAMVVVMIVVGGLTRLTDSGLSITEWAPISGAVPPMSEADWQAEFAAYQQTDEYRLQNAGMSMAEFRYIYWWEWGHRQLGRVIGLVWALGFAFMLATGRMPRGWTGRFVLLGALGGLQGAIGWWMVHSGLQAGMVDVASYRLATHLGIAFLILSLIAWYVLRLSRDEADLLQARRGLDRTMKGMTTGLLHLSFVQMLIGALVAGIDAGRLFPDWPLMAGGIMPPDMWQIEPVWRNLFENAGTVQFIHRVVGYVLAALAIGVVLAARKSANRAVKGAAQVAAAMIFVQATLGVVTVMHSSPLYLAILHQLGAVFTIVLILRARFAAMHPPMQSARGA